MAELGHWEGLVSVSALEKMESISPDSEHIDCPVCTNKSAAYIHKDVEIDICSNCLTVWLDKGELNKILAPGFDKYKKVKEHFAGEIVGDVLLNPDAVIALTEEINMSGNLDLTSALEDLGSAIDPEALEVGAEVAAEAGGAILDIIFGILGGMFSGG